MKKKFVYNLQFPDFVKVFSIGRYTFKRIPDYMVAYQGLNKRSRIMGLEHTDSPTYGTHQVTAVVTCMGREPSAVLKWNDPLLDTSVPVSHLDDLLVLLTLFTQRRVFTEDSIIDSTKVAIKRDHRLALFGFGLRAAIPRGRALSDTRFEKYMNQVDALICSKEWRERYDSGHVLFQYMTSMWSETIEAPFIICWSIWNHIFAEENRKMLTRDEVVRTSESMKIRYILSKYFGVATFNKASHEGVSELCKIRNGVVHVGRISTEGDIKVMNHFVHVTEGLIAKILGLKPSHALNSYEHLWKYLHLPFDQGLVDLPIL